MYGLGRMILQKDEDQGHSEQLKAEITSSGPNQVASSHTQSLGDSKQGTNSDSGYETGSTTEASDTEDSNSNLTTVLNCLYMNPCGFYSKRPSIENIIAETCSRVLILNETHCSRSKIPKIKGFVSFYRNRNDIRKGGKYVTCDM